MTSHAPDNAPVVRDDIMSVGRVPRTSHEWHGFQVNDADLKTFRDALRKDFGNDGAWSDDEIREMAYNSIALVLLVRRIIDRGRGAGMS